MSSAVTPEMDREYLDAVEAGDMAKAQEMVAKAAEAAGYNMRGYHGTNREFETELQNAARLAVCLGYETLFPSLCCVSCICVV